VLIICPVEGHIIVLQAEGKIQMETPADDHGRGRPRLYRAEDQSITAAQQKALEIEETGSTVTWDDDVHEATKRALVEKAAHPNTCGTPHQKPGKWQTEGMSHPE